MAIPRQRDGREAIDAFRYAGLGLTFAATIGLFAAGGFFLDRRLGTSPLFLVVGVFLGFGLGLYSMVSKVPAAGRSARKGERSTSRTDPRDPPTP